VERRSVALDDGRLLSLLAWGEQPAEIVFVHGGAQNAHTWDTVVLALGRSAIAVDLPGHGHSSWRNDGAYWPVPSRCTHRMHSLSSACRWVDSLR
jgi:pimeloyl-ACP methyl ester carboxylesterase